MHRFSLSAIFAASIALVNIAGCPLTGAADPADASTPTTMHGSWNGVLSRTSTKTVDDIQGTPLPSKSSLSISFNSNYVAVGLPIWGFDNAFDQTTVKSAAGETETFNYEANLPYRNITLVATIREATYGESSARVVIDLTYASTDAAQGLTEDGAGVMTIDAEINGATMTFTGTATYTVTQTANNNTIQTSETITCTGTLTK